MTIFPPGTPVMRAFRPEPGTREFAAAEELRCAGDRLSADLMVAASALRNRAPTLQDILPTPSPAVAEQMRRASARLNADVASFLALTPVPAPASREAGPAPLAQPIPASAFPNALAIIAGTMAAIIAPPAKPYPDRDQAE